MKTPTLSTKLKNAVLIPPDARTLAYLRVSTEDQARGDAVSLRDQGEAAERYASERGRKVDAVIEDRESGRKINRPGFQALITHCERYPRDGGGEGDRGLVICLDSSRWGRFVKRPSLAQHFADRLWLSGWDLEFTEEATTGNEDADLFLGSARSVASATESRRISYRARSGMMANARRGGWQGRPPFAYDRVGENPTTGRTRKLLAYEHSAGDERVTLTPGPAQDVRTVRKLFAWAAKGVTLEDIARRLNRAKVPGPWDRYGNNWRSGRPAQWILDNVKVILTNVAYLGQLHFAKRTSADWYGRRRRAPREEWVTVEGAWEPLVERKVFEQVQEIFASRTGRRPRVVRYLLTGMLRCTRCGALLQGGGGTRPKAPDPLRFTFYKCPVCRAPRVTLNRQWIEDKVVAAVSEHVREVIEDGSFDKVVDEVLAAQRTEAGGTRRDLERERADLKVRQERLVNAIACGILEDDEARDQLDALRRREQALEADVHKGRFAERRASLNAKERQRLKKMAVDFPTQIKRANAETARALLAYWVDALYVDMRNPKRRTGRLVLRRVPVPGFATENSARRDRVRRCWPADSRQYFPHSASTKRSRRRKSTAWPGCCRPVHRWFERDRFEHHTIR